MYAVAPGGESAPRVRLFLRREGSREWQSFLMEPAGRRTFVKEISTSKKDVPLIEYYAKAEFAGPGDRHTLTAPAGAPENLYSITLL